MILDANKLEVDVEKIKYNIDQIKSLGDRKFYAVVKANAYGLGSIELSKLIEDRVYGFCVANVYEAVELRAAGIKKEILILGYVAPENYHLLGQYDLSVIIYDFQIAKDLDALQIPIKGHIKIETGHNRLGFKVDQESTNKIKEIAQMKNLKIIGIFTHFSTADEEDRTYTNKQVDLFRKMIESLGHLADSWIKHCSNDAAAIAYDFEFDAVRSGISMYGVYPSQFIKENYPIELREAFTLKSRISFIKTVEEGQGISYGRDFVADKPVRVATVSIGYADGYHRLCSKEGYVLINGKKAKILGRITMDQMMVDVTDIDCKIHDEVVLIGKSGDLYLGVDEVASWAKTISYEVMTSISPRVARVYY